MNVFKDHFIFPYKNNAILKLVMLRIIKLPTGPQQLQTPLINSKVLNRIINENFIVYDYGVLLSSKTS